MLAKLKAVRVYSLGIISKNKTQYFHQVRSEGGGWGDAMPSLSTPRKICPPNRREEGDNFVTFYPRKLWSTPSNILPTLQPRFPQFSTPKLPTDLLAFQTRATFPNIKFQICRLHLKWAKSRQYRTYTYSKFFNQNLCRATITMGGLRQKVDAVGCGSVEKKWIEETVCGVLAQGVHSFFHLLFFWLLATA